MAAQQSTSRLRHLHSPAVRTFTQKVRKQRIWIILLLPGHSTRIKLGNLKHRKHGNIDLRREKKSKENS